MENYFKSFGRYLLKGFYSIAEGMSTLSIYPPKRKIPLSSESWKKDGEAIQSDWNVVGDDFKRTIKNLDSKL